jgi:osmotically-inducible protein OsmY
MQAAGLFLGITVGGILGPVVFNVAGLNDGGSSAIGTIVGALIGYGLAQAAVVASRRRQDRELELAANAVLRESGLPSGLTAKVKNTRAILTGEVDRHFQRQAAEMAVSSVPGIAGVANRIRLRIANGGLSAEEIRRRLEEALLRHAELDARGIKLRVENSRVILEGAVHSWTESSTVEDLVWDVPGIEEVENRLELGQLPPTR